MTQDSSDRSYEKCTFLGLCPKLLKSEKLDVVQESACHHAFWGTLAHSLRTATDAGEQRGGGTERPPFPLAAAAHCVTSAAGLAQNAVRLVVSIIKTRCLAGHRGTAYRKRKPEDGYDDAKRYGKSSGPE